MRLPTLLRFAVVLVLLSPALSLAANVPDAVRVVDKLHGTLVEVMKKADRLGYAGRFKTLAPVVGTSFDFPTIAKIVVGRYWKDLNDKQRTTFIETFAKLSSATYASEFDSFANEHFRHVSQDQQKDGRVLIKTELVKQNGEAVRLDYMLQPIDKRWLIVNVIADGVSDLALKRADYNAILKDSGFDALVARLNDKIVQYQDPKPEEVPMPHE